MYILGLMSLSTCLLPSISRGAQQYEEHALTDTYTLHPPIQCSNCPAGFNCPSKNMTAPMDCPVGHYCLEAASPLPCPSGTYAHASKGGLKLLDECTWCPSGASCTGEGLEAPSGGCAAGFFCNLGSKDDRGSANKCGTAAACPAGHYCEANATRPAPCPKGTFSNLVGRKKENDCQKCTAGQWGL